MQSHQDDPKRGSSPGFPTRPKLGPHLVHPAEILDSIFRDMSEDDILRCVEVPFRGMKYELKARILQAPAVLLLQYVEEADGAKRSQGGCIHPQPPDSLPRRLLGSGR